MEYYMILLRVLHIGLGVVWVGGILIWAFIVIPSVVSYGPEGGKFMQHLVTKTKFPMVMAITAVISMLAGILLMWELSNGFKSAWFGGAYGMSLLIGAILAIIGWLIGMTVNMPTSKKMTALSKEIAAGGGPPTEEQQKQMLSLRGTLVKAINAIAVLLTISLLLMAIARYTPML